MKYFFIRFKKQLLRLLTVVLVFGAALLVLWYFLGYYDLSFIDRYKILDEIFNDSSSGSFGSSGTSSFFELPDLSDNSDSSVNSNDGAETDGISNNASTDDDLYIYYETASVKGVFDDSRLPDKLMTTAKNGSKTVAALIEDGYSPVGISYSEAALSSSGAQIESAFYTPGETVLGKLTFSFKLPDAYSLRRRQTVRAVINYPDDDSEYYVTYENFREKRPAIELYMGYIMLDNGSDIFIIAADGTPLCMIDERVYFPAYARDKLDRPLFCRIDETTSEKLYFHLSEDGMNFVDNDYEEQTDSRGLNFDYPASYGKSDSTVVYTVKSEQTGLMGYMVKDKGMLTGYNYTSAYGFTSNRGAVTTTKNRGGMFFVNENGAQAFRTWYTYLNEHDRYVFNNLMPPATTGIENIGFYYFEYGLTRVRRQIIDNWSWSMRGLVRVTSDEHILIRTDGEEYPLPAGYTLEGYSDGMILLSKNGKYGFIDYTGEWIAQPIYSAATPFICGLATLTTSDGRVGMIDTGGNIVLQFTYDSITQVSDNIIAAYREENGWTILKLMQK